MVFMNALFHMQLPLAHCQMGTDSLCDKSQGSSV